MAAGVFVASFASVAGILSAMLGAFFGVALGDYAIRLHRVRRTGLSIIALALFCPVIANHLPLTGIDGLTALEFADLGPKAMLATWLIRALSGRFSWFRPIEALLAGLAPAQWLSAHRFGNLRRPYWIMDRWVELGLDPSNLLWVAGAISLLVVAALLAAGSPQPLKRSAGLSVLGIALLCLLASRLLPPLPFSPPAPPPPPRSQLPDPPPPPPPQPIALVQLEDPYRPPNRLGGYYLRTRSYSGLDGLEFRAVSGDFPSNTALRQMEPSDSPTASTTLVRSTVFMLDETNRVPVLLNGTIEETLLPAAPFKRAQRCVSAPIDDLRQPDLDLSTFRQQLVDTNWTPEDIAFFTRPPADSNLQALASQILGDLPEALEGYLPPRVKVVRRWMNQNLAYSAKAGQATNDTSITNFLFTTKAGGARQFATAATLLFRCAGVPSRLAGGYVVAVADGETLSQFVLADAHAQEWPEVYLQGTGWVPVPLNPTNVLDRPQPAPDPELEKALEKHAEEKPKSESPIWNAPRCRTWALLLIAAALLVWTLYGVITRYLRVLVSRPERRHDRALAAALSMAQCAGWCRRQGETYMDFALRVRTQDTSPGNQLSALILAVASRYRHSYETGFIYPASSWMRVLAQVDLAVLRFYPARTLIPFPRIRSRPRRAERWASTGEKNK